MTQLQTPSLPYLSPPITAPAMAAPYHRTRPLTLRWPHPHVPSFSSPLAHPRATQLPSPYEPLPSITALPWPPIGPPIKTENNSKKKGRRTAVDPKKKMTVLRLKTPRETD